MEKALFYQLLARLLERPGEGPYTKPVNSIPQMARPPLSQLKAVLTTTNIPGPRDYDRIVGGLPGGCSLGLNVSDAGFLASLKAFYESYGFYLDENIPVDHLPALLEFLYWMYMNAPPLVAFRIEKKVALTWGLRIVRSILKCMEEKGFSNTFYHKLLVLLENYWNNLSMEDNNYSLKVISK